MFPDCVRLSWCRQGWLGRMKFLPESVCPPPPWHLLPLSSSEGLVASCSIWHKSLIAMYLERNLLNSRQSCCQRGSFTQNSCRIVWPVCVEEWRILPTSTLDLKCGCPCCGVSCQRLMHGVGILWCVIDGCGEGRRGSCAKQTYRVRNHRGWLD